MNDRAVAELYGTVRRFCRYYDHMTVQRALTLLLAQNVAEMFDDPVHAREEVEDVCATLREVHNKLTLSDTHKCGSVNAAR